MFTVYNNGSVGFRSTADNLYELKNVDQPAQSRHKPDDDIYQNIDNSKKKKEQQSSYDKEAVNAYRKMINIETNEIIYHIEDIMIKDVICINHEQTIQEAYDILKDKKVSQIPVVSFGNKIVSMISKKIILNLLVEDLDNSRLIMNKTLNSISLPDIITTDPVSDIRRVSKVMIDFKIDAIPVVDENDIVLGIISKTDIIRSVSHIPNFQFWA
jgi:CBS domain-containing protein